MSATSLSKLISTRKEELARLLEWRGTNFPVVERQNDLRISFIELELEDLEKLNNQPQLNENQMIVLEYLKDKCSVYSFIAYKPFEAILRLSMLDPEKTELKVKNAIDELTYKQQAQVLQAFGQWALEQEEE